MRVHLVNPSDSSFGIGVITPRWLYVLAAATPARYGDPIITDETLEQIQPGRIEPGDIVGIGIHTGNALRGMEVGRIARERGAYVVYGGIHATLYPREALELGAAHAVVKGDGDVVWARVISDLVDGKAQEIYDGGRISGDNFVPARWDLAPPRPVHVGLGTDCSRLSEALLLLFRMAHRRSKTAPENYPNCPGGNCRTAPPRVSLYCLGG